MNALPSQTPVALRTIALIEIIKGALAVAAVCGLLSLHHTDLHVAVDAFLLNHGFDPEAHYTRLFVASVAELTNHNIGQVAGFGVAYALVRFAEGYGLWLGKHWAEWFAVLSAGIYLPFELNHLLRQPTALIAGITLFNIAIIVYLAKLLIQQRASQRGSSPPVPVRSAPGVPVDRP